MNALKIFGKIILALLILIVILMFVAPAKIEMEKSVKIDAPKEYVKDYLLYFEQFEKWSPWAKLDPNMKSRIEGVDGELGASLHWEGNEAVGKGMQEISLVSENRIEHLLNFEEPFKSVATSYFLIGEEEGKTEVKWGFTSSLPRPFNILALFMNISDEVGTEYQKGLDSLKVLAEKEYAEQSENEGQYEIEQINFTPRHFLTKRETVAFQGIEKFFAENLPALFSAISEHTNAEVSGQPCGIYYSWDEANAQTDLAAAVPFQSEEEISIEGYKTLALDGKALQLQHFGSYEELGKAHQAIHEYILARDLPISGFEMEEYITDPATETDTGKWLTNVYYFFPE